MMTDLDYLSRLAQTTDLETTWQMFCDKLAEYGFDRIIYGYNRFGTPERIGPWQDALILSNLDPDFIKVFIENEYYLHAPLSEWALNNSGARSWSYLETEMASLTPKQRQVVEFNMAHGLTAGYSVSFPAISERTRAAMAMAARPGLSQAEVNALWDERGTEIEVICNMTHLKIISLPQKNERARLTARQQEALNWVADGKTHQDIAAIMNITVAAVEKHLRNVREKLDVETTAQAVLKAAFWNQMFILRG